MPSDPIISKKFWTSYAHGPSQPSMVLLQVFLRYLRKRLDLAPGAALLGGARRDHHRGQTGPVEAVLLLAFSAEAAPPAPLLLPEAGAAALDGEAAGDVAAARGHGGGAAEGEDGQVVGTLVPP